MKNFAKKMLVATSAVAGVVAVAGAVSYELTKKLVKLALDRNDVQEKKKKTGLGKVISGTTISKEILEKQKADGEKLKNSPCRIVEMEAHDGHKLIGHWFEKKNAKRTIIAMHGWRSSWIKDFGMISEFLNGSDSNVLYVEQRGQNNSGGDYIGFGVIERFDCVEWSKWVSKNTSDDMGIYLYGISMGATTVLMSAELDLPKNVKGIIADCGFTSTHEIWKHVAEKNLHIYYKGILENMADEICKRKIQVGSKEVSTVKAMEHCKMPVLFIHGTNDKFVPIDMTYKNYEACNSHKRLLIVPGAEHAMSYAIEPQRYEREVLDFFKEFDI